MLLIKLHTLPTLKQIVMNENREDKNVKSVAKKLAEEQCKEEPEMHHLPTDGKKPGELEDFKKSLDNNPGKKEKTNNEE